MVSGCAEEAGVAKKRASRAAHSTLGEMGGGGGERRVVGNGACVCVGGWDAPKALETYQLSAASHLPQQYGSSPSLVEL